MPTSVVRSVNPKGEDFLATDEDIPLLLPCTRFSVGDLGDERAMVTMVLAMVIVMLHSMKRWLILTFHTFWCNKKPLAKVKHCQRHNGPRVLPL